MRRPNNTAETVPVTRVPPHNDEAEQAVLASLMIEERTFDKLMGLIFSEDFYNPNNGIIFDTIYKLYSAGQAHDLTMVASALKAAGRLEQIGGVDYLISLTQIIPNAANIGLYADHVKSKAKLRNLISAATEIHEIAYDYDRDITRDVSHALDESGQKIFELSKETSHKDPKLLEQLLEDFYTQLEHRYKDGDNTGILSEFYDLDRITNGFQPGTLVIIGGRPAMGKTAFALNIAQSAAAAKKRVAVFSLEMSSSQLVHRLISMEAEIPSQRLRSGRLIDGDWERLAEVGNALSDMKIYIDDTSSISVMEIRSKCRRMAANKGQGLDLVIIDYLQLMQETHVKEREQQIASISRNLKSLARDLEVPIIALSQVNRASTNRPEKRPQLSELRESGAIEQDADLIMFVHREEYYNQDTADKGIAEIIIAKHRTGSTGTIKLGFQGELTKFRNLDKLAFPR